MGSQSSEGRYRLLAQPQHSREYYPTTYFSISSRSRFGLHILPPSAGPT